MADTLGKSCRDVLARLAIVPMVLEARGLDMTPATIDRFTSQHDSVSASILKSIYNDEIRHVAAGTTWLESVCKVNKSLPHEPRQALVKSHFRGGLKDPFNDSACYKAGLTLNYYG